MRLLSVKQNSSHANCLKCRCAQSFHYEPINYKENKIEAEEDAKRKTRFFTQKFANFVDNNANKREGRRVKVRKLCMYASVPLCVRACVCM